MKPTAFLLVVLGAACASPTGVGALGDWGSREAHLELRASGGTVTYQCGMGTVDSGWVEGTDGSWSATGEHYFGGGPAPAGGRDPHPARYTGHVEGDQLDFTVQVLDLGDTLGPFHLVRNGPPVSELCV